MICKQCADEGKTSRVYPPGAELVTCAYYPPFYDEQGKYHVHDGNWRTGQYRCSNGHRWTVSRIDRCPYQGCSWNDQQLEAVRYDSLPEEARQQPASLAAEKPGET